MVFVLFNIGVAVWRRVVVCFLQDAHRLGSVDDGKLRGNVATQGSNIPTSCRCRRYSVLDFSSHD